MKIYILLVMILLSSCSEKNKELDARVNTELTGLISNPNHPKRKEGYRAFSEIANSSIKSLKMVVEKEKGELSIEFDFEPYVWLDTDLPQGKNMLVRIFDKNGQYLTHFKTANIFLPQKSLDIAENKDFPSYIHTCSKTKRSIDFCKKYHCKNKVCSLIVKKGNKFVYSLNQKDASFAAIAEIGFSEDMNGYTEMNIPWTCLPDQSCLGLYDPKWFKNQELVNKK